MNLFDSHCHPQFPQYDADREEVIKRTLAAGCGMICVGTDLEMSKKAIELAEKYPPSPSSFGRAGVWATVGLHPDAKEVNDSRFTIYEHEELARHPKVVAIGEIGLDYYRTPEKEKQERQKEVFQQFLELGRKVNKPVIIHCRDAYNDLISILKSHIVNHKSAPWGVVHSFTSNFELAKKFLDLDLCLGLNGIITFSKEYNDMVAEVPLERILIETDAPYLAPVPNRGKRNEPLFVEFIARHIAEIKKVSFEKVASQTTKNAEKLFGAGFHIA